MSAHLAKQPAGLFTSSSVTHGAPSVQGRRGVSLFQRAAAGLRWVAGYPGRQSVFSQLQLLSDRELSDIGLVRGDIRNIFNR